MVAQLGRIHDEFIKAGAQVLVILGDRLDQARKYAEQVKAPFPILADPERTIYHLYQLERNFIGIQRTAALVIDQAGVVRYLKRVTNPNAWLQESREFLDAVQAVNSQQ